MGGANDKGNKDSRRATGLPHAWAGVHADSVRLDRSSVSGRWEFRADSAFVGEVV